MTLSKCPKTNAWVNAAGAARLGGGNIVEEMVVLEEPKAFGGAACASEVLGAERNETRYSSICEQDQVSNDFAA